MNDRGQIGLVTTLIMGIVGLVIGVIIAFLIVSTLNDASLLEGGRTTVTVTNETGNITGAPGDTLAGASAKYVPGTFTITAIVNHTNVYTIGVGNASVSNDGVVINATAELWNPTGISYTYTLQAPEEISTDFLAGNFTAGTNEVSERLPTVLLIAAIVLILAILSILMLVYQKMRGGTGGI